MLNRVKPLVTAVAGATGLLLFLLLFVERPVLPLQASALSDLFQDTGQELVSFRGNSSQAVALGDVDGDGDLDALVGQDAFFGDENILWLNRGDGVFLEDDQTLPGGISEDVALGDLDGDGDLDAVVANDGCCGDARSAVWLNQSELQGIYLGRFTQTQVLIGTFARDVVLGDLDGDDDLDAVTGASVSNAPRIWFNDGQGHLMSGPEYSAGWTNALALGDLDGDGDLDIVNAGEANFIPTQIIWNNWVPSGTFDAGPTLPTSIGIHGGVAINDLDGDGAADIFVASSDNNLVWWNHWAISGTFTAGSPFGPENDSSLAMADLDLDGDADALVGRFLNSAPNGVWLNGGDRTFAASADALGNFRSSDVALGDLDGDGDPDAFVANSGPNKVYLNQTMSLGPPLDWHLETIAAGNDAGLGLDLVVDPDTGYPHVAYAVRKPRQDQDDYQIMYAHWDGLLWRFSAVDTAEYYAPTVRLTLDSDGRPHITYFSGPTEAGCGTGVSRDNCTLHYAQWDGAAWQRVVLNNNNVFDGPADIAVDTQGHFYIIYIGRAARLIYVTGTRQSWEAETLWGVRSNPPAITLDSDDTPHIVFSDQWPIHATISGSIWISETVQQRLPATGVFYDITVTGSDTIHIAYSDVNNRLQYSRKSGAGWTSISLGPSDGRVTLALDDVDAPHLAHWDAEAGRVRYTRRDGSVWLTTEIARGWYPAVAFGDDTPMVAFYEPVYGNLEFARFGLGWQEHLLDASPVIHSPSLALEHFGGQQAGVVGYYDQNQGLVQVTGWEGQTFSLTGTWQTGNVAFVASAGADVSMPIHKPGPQPGIDSLSYYDADTQDLIGATLSNGAWDLETIDEMGDVGRYNVLLDRSTVAYYDATNGRIKVAGRDISGTWKIHTNTIGPPLNGLDVNLSGAFLHNGAVGISYYDEANDDLRLATWTPTGWFDEVIDGGPGLSGVNTLAVDELTGEPAVAYIHTGSNTIRYAVRNNGTWNISTVGPAGQVDSLSLRLEVNDAAFPVLVASDTGSGELRLLRLEDGLWTVETVVDDGHPTLAQLALWDRKHIAYVADDGLRLAVSSGGHEAVKQPKPPYNPIVPAVDCLQVLTGDGSRTVTPPAGIAGRALSDFDTFSGLTNVFVASEAGRAWISLYQEHGLEMAAIVLADPVLLWDAYRTLQNFMPGLEALVEGWGDEVEITTEMLANALDVWERLAAAASPRLGTTIETILADFNNLEDFSGQNFAEWADEIKSNPPDAGPGTFMPIVLK